MGVARLGHGPQNAPQVGRLWRGKDTVALGQVDAAHATAGQGVADGARLHPVFYQHRHGAGPGGTGIEQVHHLRGKDLGHLTQQHRLARHFGGLQVPDGHGGLGLAGHLQRLHFVIAGRDDIKRHVTKGLDGAGKHVIHGRHHARGRTEVARQGVNRPGLLARCQVGGEVGAAKAVNGLFGVADHDQAGAL